MAQLMRGWSPSRMRRPWPMQPERGSGIRTTIASRGSCCSRVIQPPGRMRRLRFARRWRSPAGRARDHGSCERRSPWAGCGSAKASARRRPGCLRRSTAGSPQASIPSISWRRRACSIDCPQTRPLSAEILGRQGRATRYIRFVALDLYDELRGIVKALNAAEIPYALVGGLAVSIYAQPRATEDVDLLLAREDLLRTIERLEELGFRRAGTPMSVAARRLEIQRLIKIDGMDLVPVDLLVPNDATLAALLTDRKTISWEDERLSIVSLAGLRTLKRLRGSAQD